MSAQNTDGQADLENFGAPPADACVNYRRCGNTIPGANNSMCCECLDRVRHVDSHY